MKATKAYNSYLGKSGHLLVMSELLYRGWNVAIPEVDTGDDIFAVENKTGDLKRVQVKTAVGKPHKKGEGYSASFSLRKDHLLIFQGQEMYYFFVVRLGDRWKKFIIIDIDTLAITLTKVFGSKTINAKGNLTVYFKYKREDSVFMKSEDISNYINYWDDKGGKYFPVVLH